MKIKSCLCFLLTISAFTPPIGGTLNAAQVTVFAAASLSDSLKEVAASYKKKSNDRIVFNLGASSTLVRQIEEGAPADVFFSADEAQMDRLEAKGLIVTATRKSRLSNSLVIIVASENGAAVDSPSDLASSKVKRLALGDPQAVPIGVYARRYLESLKLWTSIAPKVVPTENVRAALAAVEAGNADASIVYKTDATITKKVKIVFEVPPNDSPRISYPTALVNGSAEPTAGKNFLDYLDSEESSRTFRKYGFVVMPAAVRR